MFEQIVTGRLNRARRALREFVDLSACDIFTVRQQLLRSCLAAAIGAATALVVAGWQMDHIAPVIVSGAEIERLQPDYSVYRIRFEWRGIEISSCHIVIYGETGKWTVKC